MRHGCTTGSQRQQGEEEDTKKEKQKGGGWKIAFVCFFLVKKYRLVVLFLSKKVERVIQGADMMRADMCDE